MFVEYTSIDMRGFKILSGGQKVIFTDLRLGDVATEAAMVRPVPERAKPSRYTLIDDGCEINSGLIPSSGTARPW